MSRRKGILEEVCFLKEKITLSGRQGYSCNKIELPKEVHDNNDGGDNDKKEETIVNNDLQPSSDPVVSKKKRPRKTERIRTPTK